jgi:hypothetical protein
MCHIPFSFWILPYVGRRVRLPAPACRSCVLTFGDPPSATDSTLLECRSGRILLPVDFSPGLKTSLSGLFDPFGSWWFLRVVSFQRSQPALGQVLRVFPNTLPIDGFTHSVAVGKNDEVSTTTPALAVGQVRASPRINRGPTESCVAVVAALVFSAKPLLGVWEPRGNHQFHRSSVDLGGLFLRVDPSAVPFHGNGA